VHQKEHILGKVVGRVATLELLLRLAWVDALEDAKLAKVLSVTCSLATAIVRVMYRPAEPTFFFVFPIEFLLANFFLPRQTARASR